MSKTSRRKFTSGSKPRYVCIEAIKERQSIESLSKKYDLHPMQINTMQINTWKKEFCRNACADFALPCLRPIPFSIAVLNSSNGQLAYSQFWSLPANIIRYTGIMFLPLPYRSLLNCRATFQIFHCYALSACHHHLLHALWFLYRKL